MNKEQIIELLDSRIESLTQETLNLIRSGQLDPVKCQDYMARIRELNWLKTTGFEGVSFSL